VEIGVEMVEIGAEIGREIGVEIGREMRMWVGVYGER
jgi:hypothetical protein